MAEKLTRLAEVDPVWTRIRDEAECMVRDEPLLGGLVHSSILHHESIECALAYRIALKLASGEMSEQLVREITDAAFKSDSELALSARADIVAVFE
ncbi:MAG: serine O-acetyltransferase, partial [Rhodobacteraceae bacterium]|nr:serine O-acetyltransferase [Paracoccaceae bacterium]